MLAARLAPFLGLQGGLIASGLRVWKKAVANADDVGARLPSYLAGLDGPIHLIGHSLGGRIVLRASGRNRYSAIDALAPAVLEREVDLSGVARSSVRRPKGYYSAHDRVILGGLFRFAEWGKPLGLVGPRKSRSVSGVDAAQETGMSLGHNDYHKHLRRLISVTRSPTKPQTRRMKPVAATHNCVGDLCQACGEDHGLQCGCD